MGRENIAVLRGSLDDARRRDVGKTASQDEMICVGCSYGGTGCFEITLSDQRGKRIATREELPARSIGMIGRILLACVALINGKTSVRRLDPLCCIQRLPGLRRRVPHRIESRKITIELAQPTESRHAPRRRPLQPKKQGEQLSG